MILQQKFKLLFKTTNTSDPSLLYVIFYTNNIFKYSYRMRWVNQQHNFKGTVTVISTETKELKSMPDLQRYPLNRRYVFCPTHHLSWRSFVQQAGKTAFVLHTICSTHHLSYTTFVLHIICPTHHTSYTSYVLHIIYCTHHLSYT